MFRMFIIAAGLALLVTTTGCMTVQSPAIGAFYADVAWSQEVPNAGQNLKSGSGIATSFFGMFAAGDVSVERIMQSAGITQIHHIDTHTTNICGFGKLVVTVYGE